MSYEAITERGALLRPESYGTSGPLLDRAAIYRFMEKGLDFVDWALSKVEIPQTGRVLDIGCGPGLYLRRLAASRPHLELVGADLSPQMLAEAVQAVAAAGGRLRGLRADVCALPHVAGAFDVVLATHMLYHAPDLELAACELRRVLAGGGVLLAVTNGVRHQAESRDLLAAAATEVAGKPVVIPDPFSARFSLENGAGPLATVFDVEGPHVLADRLVVPEPGPVVAYMNSMRAHFAPALPEPVSWDDVIAAVERQVVHGIDREGAWRITTQSGVFVCRPR